MQVTCPLQSLINSHSWTRYLNCAGKKSKVKDYRVVILISVFRTAVLFFFFDLSGALTMVQVIEGKCTQK